MYIYIYILFGCRGCSNGVHKYVTGLEEGRRCIGLDIKIGGEAMDLTTTPGFIAAVYQTCRLTPGSGWLAAPVCSSFVFMSLVSYSLPFAYRPS